jgi:nitrite reductase (NO-forming)
MMNKYSTIWLFFVVLIFSTLALAGCETKQVDAEQVDAPDSFPLSETLTPSAAPVQPLVEFTLQTAVKDGRILYIGVGGSIDGVVNPDLQVKVGEVVRVLLVDGDGMQHDFFVPDFNAQIPYVMGKGDQAEVVFEVEGRSAGVYAYYCTVPGHRQAGQEGKLIVSEP